MARVTMASLQAELEELRAQLKSAPVVTSEASAHFKAKDLAVTCCDKLFKTESGRTFHFKNTHKNGKAIA